MFKLIRLFDIFLSLLGLIILLPIIILLLLIGYFDTGRPVFFQERVGFNRRVFLLYKFRTMHLSTQSLGTHLINKNSITKFGSFLRKSKFDELLQLINVLKGDMSLVGPRPNLVNQTEVIHERLKLDIYKVRPGITGLAQIKKIDMSVPKLLAETDLLMIKNFNVFQYFKFIFITLSGKGLGDRIR
jgi:O-antigen biosynthesis protein WbqP